MNPTFTTNRPKGHHAMRHFRPTLIAIALVSLVFLGGCSAAPSSSTTPSGSTGPAPNTAQVSLKNIAINPSDIVVAVGGTVLFTNNDTVTHDIAGTGFDTGALAPGATFSQVFNTAGSFPIHCTIHPSMTANITVK
jgi:plastocyanin